MKGLDRCIDAHLMPDSFRLKTSRWVALTKGEPAPQAVLLVTHINSLLVAGDGQHVASKLASWLMLLFPAPCLYTAPEIGRPSAAGL